MKTLEASNQTLRNMMRVCPLVVSSLFDGHKDSTLASAPSGSVAAQQVCAFISDLHQPALTPTQREKMLSKLAEAEDGNRALRQQVCPVVGVDHMNVLPGV
jgi:hypothetical protein